jgi:hypothetical protein
VKITGLTVHVLEPRPNARHDKPDRLEASTFSNAIGIIHHP